MFCYHKPLYQLYYKVIIPLHLICSFTDATVFLQDAELDVLEGTNVSVCGEIELAGELLADINIEFLAIGGGPGAGKALNMIDFRISTLWLCTCMCVNFHIFSKKLAPKIISLFNALHIE